MAAGMPISLLPLPEYRERSEQARRIFSGGSASDAHDSAERLGVDYVWVDAADRLAYGRGVRYLEGTPELFEPVFRNSEVTVFAVR
jgi:uncharacterized membrane protein